MTSLTGYHGRPFTYTLTGERASVSDASGATNYTYDTAGKLSLVRFDTSKKREETPAGEAIARP